MIPSESFFNSAIFYFFPFFNITNSSTAAESAATASIRNTGHGQEEELGLSAGMSASETSLSSGRPLSNSLPSLSEDGSSSAGRLVSAGAEDSGAEETGSELETEGAWEFSTGFEGCMGLETVGTLSAGLEGSAGLDAVWELSAGLEDSAGLEGSGLLSVGWELGSELGVVGSGSLGLTWSG